MALLFKKSRIPNSKKIGFKGNKVLGRKAQLRPRLATDAWDVQDR
jgi:hypothetical protein